MEESKFKNKIINPKNIKLVCDSKIAFDSPDYLHPHGTKHDNSKNPRFNKKLYKLYSKVIPPLKILDLGSAGGGFVKSCIDDGCFAIGLEGSDYSKRLKRAEWRTIPKYLFTCDISKNFSIFSKKEILKFEVITAWEVLEHISEDRIDILIKNIKKHLSDQGLFIASVSNNSDSPNGVEMHQTQRPKDWWIKKFENQSFREEKNLLKFFKRDFVRSIGMKETRTYFHLILSTKKGKLTSPSRVSFKGRVFDFLYNSRFFILLRMLMN